MKEISNEVFYADQSIVQVDQKDIQFLKDKALENKRQRSRLCTHHDTEDILHEMLIIHTPNTYVRPHKHVNKSESFHVLEGTANVIIFDADGHITKVVQMGDYLSGKTFYYRLSSCLYHTLIITSDIIVFHETTNGPFNRDDTVFASWSPSDNKHEVAKYMENLVLKSQQFLFDL